MPGMNWEESKTTAVDNSKICKKKCIVKTSSSNVFPTGIFSKNDGYCKRKNCDTVLQSFFQEEEEPFTTDDIF